MIGRFGGAVGISMAERFIGGQSALAKTAAAADAAFKVPELMENPTPEDRAEYVVLRLEQFIRDGRTIDEGMSFRKWQQMAKVEIANAVAEAEISQQKDDVVTKRLLFVAASAMVTVGFWGTAVSLHQGGHLWGAIVSGTAGFLLMAVACE